MKSYKNLFGKVVSFNNLLLAARRAQRGKRFKTTTAKFNLRLEEELLSLQRELINQSYRPGKYREFHIYEPKLRAISAAPYRDRVVHHALMNVIEPLFDRSFIYDSYACRKGKGTHKAIERCSNFVRQNEYVLKIDIYRYFPSIDHEILFQLIAKRIRDKETLWLIKTIIDSSNPQEPVYEYFPGDDLFTPFERKRGIPIGNLTSQFFGNLYLNPLDHFIKNELGCRYCLRYVDDLVVLDNDKNRLHELRREIENFLVPLRLKTHPKKTRVFPNKLGVEFLGFRIYPHKRLLRKENAYRFLRRAKKLAWQHKQGNVSIDKVAQSICAWIAHASWGDTEGLRRRLLGSVVFTKGG